jgi:hypothetical protein
MLAVALPGFSGQRKAFSMSGEIVVGLDRGQIEHLATARDVCTSPAAICRSWSPASWTARRRSPRPPGPRTAPVSRSSPQAASAACTEPNCRLRIADCRLGEVDFSLPMCHGRKGDPGPAGHTGMAGDARGAGDRLRDRLLSRSQALEEAEAQEVKGKD